MMKIAGSISIVLALVLSLCAGCSKKEEAKAVGTNDVDIPRLQAVFTNANPEMASALTQVAYGVRYGDLVKSLVALDKLANAPETTAEQKKVVNETIEQVKKLAAQQSPPPGQ